MDIRSGEPRLNAFNGGHPESAVVPARGIYPRLIKPVLDRVLGLTLLIVAIPFLLAVALVVLFSIGRPLLYSHQRIGFRGEPFTLYKFRTMLPDRRNESSYFNGEERRMNHKSPHDPRHTRVGRFLRATRLDELPQLWNVVRGDMSLVGPRPEVPAVVDRYQTWQHQRHLVKPGLTGLWQISAQNGKPMHECTELDLEYVSRIGFSEDMSILLRTPFAMLGTRRGR